jgi:anti-anti-sigma factor
MFMVEATVRQPIRNLMIVDQERRSGPISVLHVEGSLRAPVSTDLRHAVRVLLRRGERTIVVSLARVFEVDAAGVGELVRAYNMTTAADGVLRVVDVSPRVREVLARVGLLNLLSADSTVSAASL